ncbi:hypothetical protein D8674_024356 [Pyrus ussuriensis x Pyrus communis]|uniref:Uncharacterized protein n=1 Tax=Pyrus ussuriensis x Pyrus communis TaxID=2448454 RepID=A0A5N5HG77_9ROSA|nr:hypothetical protein D8674_024356 [Pyrus ussuriensis x Pyrus communis]
MVHLKFFHQRSLLALLLSRTMYDSSSSTQGSLLLHSHRLLPFFLLWLQIEQLNPSTTLNTFDSIPQLSDYVTYSPNCSRGCGI